MTEHEHRGVSANPIVRWWRRFEDNHRTIAQFLMFFILSNGVTVLQFILMPVFKWIFGMTTLVLTSFQFLPLGSTSSGAVYLFDYPAGALPEGGGGLAYFLAVQITIAIAQVVNFFAQRSITFKSNSSVWWAAMWYLIAYIGITILAAAAQVWYKEPIYGFFMTTLGWGTTGETIADVITMTINAAISFWVFFPIFKLIFRRREESAQ